MNFAIHIAAVTQFRNQSEGRVYYDRKIGEGKTHKEAVLEVPRFHGRVGCVIMPRWRFRSRVG